MGTRDKEGTKMTGTEVQERDVKLKSLFSPTSPEFVSTRDAGKAGRLSYVEWGYVASRLAADFPGFDFTLLDIRSTPEGHTVWARLTLDGVNRENVGWAPQKPITGGAVDNGVKDAVSDAFKRCGAMFGVGLDLYGKGATAEAVSRVGDPEPVIPVTDEPEIVPEFYPQPKPAPEPAKDALIERIKHGEKALESKGLVAFGDEKVRRGVRGRYLNDLDALAAPTNTIAILMPYLDHLLTLYDAKGWPQEEPAKPLVEKATGTLKVPPEKDALCERIKKGERELQSRGLVDFSDKAVKASVRGRYLNEIDALSASTNTIEVLQSYLEHLTTLYKTPKPITSGDGAADEVRFAVVHEDGLELVSAETFETITDPFADKEIIARATAWVESLVEKNKGRPRFEQMVGQRTRKFGAGMSVAGALATKFLAPNDRLFALSALFGQNQILEQTGTARIVGDLLK